MKVSSLPNTDFCGFVQISLLLTSYSSKAWGGERGKIKDPI